MRKVATVWVAVAWGLALARAGWALTAADLYDEAPSPPPNSSFNGAMMSTDTEVLTPQGIVDESAFTPQTPNYAADDTLSQISPAAGPSNAIASESLAPLSHMVTPFVSSTLTPPSPTLASPTIAAVVSATAAR